jgi:hypothetical protein
MLAPATTANVTISLAYNAVGRRYRFCGRHERPPLFIGCLSIACRKKRHLEVSGFRGGDFGGFLQVTG